MDVPLVIHVNQGAIETLAPKHNHLVLQARSLRNSLNVLRRRLKYMQHKTIFTFEDVEHYKHVLDTLESRWRNEEGDIAGVLTENDPALADQCANLWTECYNIVKDLEEDALEMPPEMRTIHSKLSDIHVELLQLAEREHTSAEVATVINKLDEIDAARIEGGGLFYGDIEAPAPGNVVCNDLLSQDYDLAREVAASAHDEPKELRMVVDKLRGIGNDLRKLSDQQHTAADVSHYHFLLMAIASSKAEYPNEWRGSEAERLMEQCLAMAEQLEKTAEPMTAEVQKVYDELKALEKQLSTAASKSGRPSEDELQQWMDALNEIDNERAKGSGVWGGDDEGLTSPAGQAVCRHLLEDSYGLLTELLER